MQESLEIRVDASQVTALISRIADAMRACQPRDLPKRVEDMLHILTPSIFSPNGVLVIKAEPTEWSRQLLARFDALPREDAAQLTTGN
jgi:hypothetical protein